MSSKVRRAFLSTVAILAVTGVADAQQSGARPEAAQPAAAPALIQAVPTAPTGARISDSDQSLLRSGLDSARRGDLAGARSAQSAISDPIARKIVQWATVDANSDRLGFFELDQARRDLAGWPRAARRQNAAEKLLETSGQTPQQIVAWFGGGKPATAEGVLALAGALRATGRSQEAADLVRDTWRNRAFDVDLQRQVLARFGDVLTVDDHVRRADTLLYGAQGPAAREMIPLLPADQQQTALARMALRSGAAGAVAQASALPQTPGLAFELAAYYRRNGQESLAYPLLKAFPRELPTSEMADRIWDERYRLTLAALRAGDARNAYAAAADTGLDGGPDAAEAEFYAGWIALTRLQDPTAAERHFKALDRIGTSPITRGRALYWRGRAVEAMAGVDAAQPFYAAAARYNLTFYGLLAQEKLGDPKLVIGSDPPVTQADRLRFEGREPVRAARILMESGERDLFRVFVLNLDDILPNAEEEALLVDLARGYGEQDTSMKVVRAAAQRGFVLPERGYPLRTPPEAMNAPEPALVLGITRQESGFDPSVRSGAGARGMMQLLPGTAAIVARRTGVSFSPSMLDEPDYNMRLGSTYLGNMIGSFSGSYVMAIAGYNAGPGRPAQWTAFCGDPRGSGTDPIDFIECIPFSETRNYVMRVMEGMAVYRARMNGGVAPITLSQDLKRGGYVYASANQPAGAAGGLPAPSPNP